MTTTVPAPVARAHALAPNAYAAVMGTGIVSAAAAGLPVAHSLLTGLAEVVWVSAALLLVAVVVGSVGGGDWRAHPQMAHFLGARAMAPMSVAAATLLAGPGVVGDLPAYVASLVLWVVGTALGLATAVSRPVRAHRTGPAEAAWLMPVVPPMVSAAVGALLAARSPEPLATVLLAASWACFALTLVLAAGPALAVVRRVAGGDVPVATPTLFIVLGPLGQSATAALLLAPGHRWALAYAGVVLVAALLWAGVALTCVLRQRPAFAMTWWAFTFPVGTVVTGLSGLAAATGSGAVALLAVLGWGALLTVWAVVAGRTLSTSLPLGGRR
ncbi:C4-dicarboxylate ABC transporter [Nocardioides sp. CFH 31398]|uniref:SLAC1 family transporter n=1 Tax=Nocardioides sp. CFH 31398 TaxID=2919579 RepID=UPI001F06C741|nr:C4-dicarboxylate ABC transporter [Nocardioides sp. CFH 31398]MCH1868977.1 C4-dicarboxylate ABC transporter [Nocardioides sp. CFH 31398]